MQVEQSILDNNKMENQFCNLITEWYNINKRDLPWRKTSNPYHIWISEIILQQTRIAQGLDYYIRFINHFPDIKSLANASEDEVLLLWQGLGYYSRARNLHNASKEIMEQYRGIFPSSYKEIRALKGIGDYTAAAIASFAFGLPYAVLDGNVFRVLSRYFEIDTPIDSNEGKKQFSNLSQSLLDINHPASYNQGLMDLGATICLPLSPKCFECPLQNSCLALNNNKIHILPVKGKKVVQKNRYLSYFVITDEKGAYYIHKRDKNDIWKGLYEFPLIEHSHPFDETKNIEEAINSLSEFFTNITIQKIHLIIKHQLTHQNIFAQFIEANASIQEKTEYTFLSVNKKELPLYAVSKLTETFLSNQR